MLARRGEPAVGLTSARNAAFVSGLGLYRQTVIYDAPEELGIDGPIAFVDMAGDAGLRLTVHRLFGEQMVHSAVVGSTHHEAPPAAKAEPLPGPPPTFFFAPDRLTARRRDWGGSVLSERIGAAMASFIDESAWLRIEHHAGHKALTAAYQSILAGNASSDRGDIVLPRCI